MQPCACFPTSYAHITSPSSFLTRGAVRCNRGCNKCQPQQRLRPGWRFRQAAVRGRCRGRKAGRGRAVASLPAGSPRPSVMDTRPGRSRQLHGPQQQQRHCHTQGRSRAWHASSMSFQRGGPSCAWEARSTCPISHSSEKVGLHRDARGAPNTGAETTCGVNMYHVTGPPCRAYTSRPVVVVTLHHKHV